ncbi:MAG: type I-E CRISPR-associated protein Cas6/Cse3/CasE [Phycisphaerae bacterium]|nr:type I-E CRISPR-associated protein Cas6/Cse3/CasE [Phycisphaerae bacterium]NUQ09047.1 type I-E CRISPR-associated protein Cas6/Cse3/CasE [Phycisphaerae bacterium]
MYLSCLLINVGDNPDRPRPGRLWLRNRYHVHQRLCMAFPTPSQREQDPEFLMPYEPCGFLDPRPERCAVVAEQVSPSRGIAPEAADRPIHVPRDKAHNFLHRVDVTPNGRVVILVQSALEPDWDYAFHNARHLLAALPETKADERRFERGQRLRFRLLSNPTKRLREASLDANGQPVDRESFGKRVPVPPDQWNAWLGRRAPLGGFKLTSIESLEPGYVYVNKTHETGKGQQLRAVRYDGILEVVDADRFREIIIRGIGPAKAFGFGLLSVAPVR